VRPHQRAFALVLALVFLATSIATGLAVVWSIRQEKNTENTTINTPANNQEVTTLKGTKLADFTPVQSVDELQKIDIKAGSGDAVEPGASVTVHYTGALAADGTIFESSKDSGQPASFPLDGVIKGWTEGVPGMKVGGTRRLVIPADKAYGAQGAGTDIPPNANLVFDIELISID
jgi:FKBP-type peptidyl-prolyl cis-trans isomerase